MSYDVVLLLSRAADVAPELGDLEPAPTTQALADAIGHTRDWPGAAAAATSAPVALRLREELPSEERVPALLTRVAATAARLPCVAVWWIPAQRLIAPAALAAAARDGDPLRVALNVRLFHVDQGAADERVMDTVGLEALGLPDVQCHFVGMDPPAIAALLDETARYLYDEGDVITDGDTISGSDGEPWSCRREAALVDPPRDVIDIAPPAAHAPRPPGKPGKSAR